MIACFVHPSMHHTCSGQLLSCYLWQNRCLSEMWSPASLIWVFCTRMSSRQLHRKVADCYVFLLRCDREDRHRGLCNHRATIPGPASCSLQSDDACSRGQHDAGEQPFAALGCIVKAAKARLQQSATAAKHKGLSIVLTIALHPV